MRSIKFCVFLLLSTSSLSFADESLGFMEATCAAHKNSKKKIIKRSNSCDPMILAISCLHPEANNFTGLDQDIKRDFLKCVKEKGYYNANTDMAKSFHPNFESLAPNVSNKEENTSDDGLIRRTFSSYDLQTAPQLYKLNASLIIATELETPSAPNIIKLINANIRHEEKYKDLSIEEINRIKEDHLVQKLRSIREERRRQDIFYGRGLDKEYYIGEEISDQNTICQLLEFDKAEKSIISNNIISADSKNGRAMKIIDESFNLFSKNDITIQGTKDESDEDKAVKGYRYFESITCVKKTNIATKEEKEVLDDIESKFFVADAKKVPAAIVFDSDPYKAEVIEEKEKQFDGGRAPAVKPIETDDFEEWDEVSIKSKSISV